ncbi:putative ABC bile acid transporter [Xylariales sp. PMI_506]|nr:putative ABC bile acid transporter [Xylariales sp. PMI_506]
MASSVDNYDLLKAFAVGLVTLLSFSSISGTFRGASRIDSKKRYEDEDGVATEVSEAAIVQAPATHFIVLGATIGLASSLFGGRLSFSSSKPTESVDWLLVGLWVLISTQATKFRDESSIKRRYSHAIKIALSTAVVFILSIYQHLFTREDGHFQFWLQAGAAIVVLFAFSGISQRPIVLFHAYPVDQERGASLFAKLSFSWSPLHEPRFRRPDNLTLDDLPVIAYRGRVKTLRQSFGTWDEKSILWRLLLQMFWPQFVQQWLFVLLNALCGFASRYSLHHLLRHLEFESTSNGHVWKWVVGLGLTLVLESIIEGWVHWITQTRLEMPIITLLKALIFEKTTKRQLLQTSAPSAQTKGGKLAARYSSISLNNVFLNDSSSVAQACAYSHHFPMVAFKMVFDVMYLAKLIGIRNILIASATSIVLIPLSSRVAKRHTLIQAEMSTTHDTLSNLILEAFQGLRRIRLSSMERAWKDKLLYLRTQELDCVWRTTKSMAMLTLVANLGPILLVSVALSLYAYQTGHLGPSVAFASLSLFGNLHEIFSELPEKVAGLNESWISCQRIQQYLDESEQQKSSVPCDTISIKRATIAWPESGNLETASAIVPADFQLRDVNVAFPKSELSVISGKTGSGKSLLIAAILEEARLLDGWFGRPSYIATPLSGTIENWILPGTTALVSQPPWIENNTIKNNILFGCPFEETRYRDVLAACALDQDLIMLRDGDETKAGVNGAVLSGGQKWRVALARALYSRAEILILEDILSAVDPHVARWICANALTDTLAEFRTRILVTNQPELCLNATRYSVVIQEDTTQSQTLTPYAAMKKPGFIDHMPEVLPSDGPTTKSDPSDDVKRAGARNISKRTNYQIFSAYISASGTLRTCILGVIVALLYQFSTVSHSWWLARWSAQPQEVEHLVLFNIGIYLALSIGNAVALAVQSLVICGIGLRASELLFQRTVHSIIAARLQWIDSTPLGQILQSLEGDMYIIDHRTAPELNALVSNIINLCFIVLTSVWYAPSTIFSSFVLLTAYLHIASEYRTLGEKLKKLIPAAQRPQLEHLSSTAAGLATIRAFDRREFYVDRMYELIDSGTRVGRQLALGIRWMDVRLSFLGAVFVTITAVALVLNRADAATSGYTITLAFQLKTTLAGALRKVGVATMGSYAIERVLELTEIPVETEDGNDPPDAWPTEGALEVHNVTVSYDPTIPPALKGVSFNVKPRQRLGIVGRTGAGKTSLINTILRFIDASKGGIIIDGLEISKLKLRSLRSAVTIIPQDPFLFSGTLRSNLDLTGDMSDDELRKALRRVHLFRSDADPEKDNQSMDLDMHIHSGGANLSYGERQLVCLARAILAQCRVLILDEATSAVDNETDATIQKVIREEFSMSTILVVAHRLATVADFDMILVFNNGEVVEFGTPANLLAKRYMFWDMVRQGEDAEKIRSIIERKDQHVSATERH